MRLFGSLILQRHLRTDKRSEGRRSGSAAGLLIRLQCGSLGRSARRTAGFQMIQHLWPLAVFMCPPNLPSLPPPSSFLHDPHLPHLSQTPWITPLLSSSSTLNKDNLLRFFPPFHYVKLCILTLNNAQRVKCPVSLHMQHVSDLT